jgi:polyhydroxyalkanoate synthesis regulator phasin
LPSISAEEVVNLFEADVRARKRLAELLVSEPDVRLAIINAVLRDVATKDDIESLRAATKDDIEALRKEFKSDIEALRREVKGDIESLRGELKEGMGKLDGRVGALEQRVARLEGSISLFTKLFIAFNLPLLVSVIVALVMMLLRAR